MQDFKKLKVWQKAHQLALAIYETTHAFPRTEQYSLTAQMRRCVISIPSNIAEGTGRGSKADFARFLQIALGSASELEYQILLARDLGYMGTERHSDLNTVTVEIKRMLAGLIRKLTTEN